MLFQPFPDYELEDEYNTGSGPLGIVIADLDGDGLLDMAVVNEGSDSISIMKGNALGEFSLLSTLTGASVNLPVISQQCNGFSCLYRLISDQEAAQPRSW